MTKTFYHGLYTKNYESKGFFDLHDVALVEADLLNEIFTLKGERLHMPEFGTRIPLLIFEPGDQETSAVLEEDITSVIERDPRVSLEDLSIIEPKDRNALVAIAKVRYLEFDVVRDLNIEVNSR